jgi:hypothetical protein
LKNHGDDVTERREYSQVIKRFHDLLHQNHRQYCFVVKTIECCKLLHEHIGHSGGAVQNIVWRFQVSEVI